jgi:hypothetical protein
MNLVPTKLEYQFETSGGYGFRVVAEWEPERGWRATVQMVAGGMANPDDAVAHLRHAAEAFLHHIKKDGP